MNTMVESEKPEVGKWVAVIYDEEWFPGLVEEVREDKLIINFMFKDSKRFFWPANPDRQTVSKSGVLCILEAAPYPVSSRRFAIAEDEYFKINQLCASVLAAL